MENALAAEAARPQSHFNLRTTFPEEFYGLGELDGVDFNNEVYAMGVHARWGGGHTENASL